MHKIFGNLNKNWTSANASNIAADTLKTKSNYSQPRTSIESYFSKSDASSVQSHREPTSSRFLTKMKSLAQPIKTLNARMRPSIATATAIQESQAQICDHGDLRERELYGHILAEPNAEKFDMSSYREMVSDEDLQILVHMMPDLSELNLDGCTNLTNEGLQHLKHLDKLEHLSLAGTEISDPGIKYLCTFDKLRTLNLSSCQAISSEIQDYVMMFLQNNALKIKQQPETPTVLLHIKGLLIDTGNRQRSVKFCSLNIPTSQEEQPRMTPETLLYNQAFDRAGYSHSSAADLAFLAFCGDSLIRSEVARNSATPAEVMLFLAKDTDQRVLLDLARNPVLDLKAFDYLSQRADINISVQSALELK